MPALQSRPRSGYRGCGRGRFRRFDRSGRGSPSTRRGTRRAPRTGLGVPRERPGVPDALSPRARAALRSPPTSPTPTARRLRGLGCHDQHLIAPAVDDPLDLVSVVIEAFEPLLKPLPDSLTALVGRSVFRCSPLDLGMAERHRPRHRPQKLRLARRRLVPTRRNLHVFLRHRPLSIPPQREGRERSIAFSKDRRMGRARLGRGARGSTSGHLPAMRPAHLRGGQPASRRLCDLRRGAGGPGHRARGAHRGACAYRLLAAVRRISRRVDHAQRPGATRTDRKDDGPPDRGDRNSPCIPVVWRPACPAVST